MNTAVIKDIIDDFNDIPQEIDPKKKLLYEWYKEAINAI